MCDCYVHGCKVCGKGIEMHLADFSTARDEIEVYCRKHIPARRDDRKDGVVWKWRDRAHRYAIFVRALTPNAKQMWDGNMPNVYSETTPTEIFGENNQQDKEA